MTMKIGKPILDNHYTIDRLTRLADDLSHIGTHVASDDLPTIYVGQVVDVQRLHKKARNKKRTLARIARAHDAILMALKEEQGR